MIDNSTDEVPRWLWRAVVGGLAVVLTAALGLLIALALGWNNPRPSGPPDWQAPGLPHRVRAPPDSAIIELQRFPTGGRSETGAGFILDGTMAPVAGSDFNGYGLAYRAQNAMRYSVFAVGGDGYYAVLRVAGAEVTPLVTWQQFPHIRRGQAANRLRVECSGANCDFYINDEYATSVEDDTWIEGDFGLWVRSFDEQAAEVEFATVGVWLRR